MNSVLTRLRAAWSVLLGREHLLVHAVEDDAVAALRRLHDRLIYATLIMKELPVALIDTINAIPTAVDAFIATKDGEMASVKTQLDAATATIADRDKQIADADTAAQAVLAKYVPAQSPPDVNPPAPSLVDPASGLPLAA